MLSIGKLISNVKEFYNDINSATLTGAIDVVVVEQPDKTLVCSPFHVRFGKLGVLRSREKVVDIEVNGEFIPLQMKLDDAGVAFFVEELDDDSVPNEPHMMCSPIPPDKAHNLLDDQFQENPPSPIEKDEVSFVFPSQKQRGHESIPRVLTQRPDEQSRQLFEKDQSAFFLSLQPPQQSMLPSEENRATVSTLEPQQTIQPAEENLTVSAVSQQTVISAESLSVVEIVQPGEENNPAQESVCIINEGNFQATEGLEQPCVESVVVVVEQPSDDSVVVIDEISIPSHERELSAARALASLSTVQQDTTSNLSSCIDIDDESCSTKFLLSSREGNLLDVENYSKSGSSSGSQQSVYNSTPMSEGESISALKKDLLNEELSDIVDNTVVPSENESSSYDSDRSTLRGFSASDFLATSNSLKCRNNSSVTETLSAETKEPRAFQRKVDDAELAYQSSESSCTYDTTPSDDEREKPEGNIICSGDSLKSGADGLLKVTARDEESSAPVKEVSKSTVGVKKRRRKKISSKKISQKKISVEIDGAGLASQLGEEPKDFNATYCVAYKPGTDSSTISTASFKTASSSVRNASIAEKPSQEKTVGECDDDLSVALSRMPHSQMDENFAFFSDTELAEGNNDDDHFPSDTECFIKRKEESDEMKDDEREQSWRWGELPTPSPQVPVLSKKDSAEVAEQSDAKDDKDEKQDTAAKQPGRSLFNMFNFMNMTKKIRRNPESEGIYLEDLDSGDITPEVAALYFPTAYRRSQLNQPTESTFVVPAGALAETDSTSPSSEKESSTQTITAEQERNEEFSEISLSLCGKQIYTSPVKDEIFENYKVTYDIFMNEMDLFENPNLIVRFDGQYMTWECALPQIISLMIFKKHLPVNVVKKLHEKYEHAAVDEPVEHPAEGISSSEAGPSYKLWLPWRRTGETKESKLAVEGDGESKTGEDGSATVAQDDDKQLSSARPKSLPRLTSVLQAGKQTIPAIRKESSEGGNGSYKHIDVHDGSSGSGSSDDAELVVKSYPHEAFESSSYRFQSSDKLHRKTLRLTSNQLLSLNLQAGLNKVVFSVTTAYQGTTRCMCHVYKWRYDDKIVISDIDGTITRSDVLGHVLPMLGKDWAQTGVAQLFTKISNNGYKLLYLSARAIGQSTVTRDYLKSVKQDNLSLPEGPVLLSPTSLINAFHREVIEKKPEHFKIPCLKDLVSLFPPYAEPMYAGFGNRDSDFFAYSMVGIPEDRIFTINTRGQVRHGLRQILISSYSNLTDVVDQMFPPNAERQEADRYSSFTHWRAPVQDIFE